MNSPRKEEPPIKEIPTSVSVSTKIEEETKDLLKPKRPERIKSVIEPIASSLATATKTEVVKVEAPTQKKTGNKTNFNS